MESNLFFKNLVKKWLEALEIFKWQNLKLFLLGSLATFSHSLLLFLKYFWWLVLLQVFVFCLSTNNLILPMLLFKFLSVFISGFLIFFALASIRPSIENKNFAYFIIYFKKFFLGFLVFFLLTMFIENQIFSWLILTMASLFYLDSKGGVESFFHSFFNVGKILLYFCPVLLLLWLFGSLLIGLAVLISFGIVFLLAFFNFVLNLNFDFNFTALNFMLNFDYFSLGLSGLLLFILGIFIIFLFKFFFFSVWTVYYIKVKHQDFQLFLK